MDTAQLQAEILDRSPQSLGQMVLDRVAATPDAMAFTYPDEHDNWVELSWAELKVRLDRFAAALLAHGLQPTDRVAIIASTRVEWVIACYGIALAGGATTTVYPNTNRDDVGWILGDSGARFVVAENELQLAKIEERHELDDIISTIVLIEGESQSNRVLSWGDFLQSGQDFLDDHPTAVAEATAGTNHDTMATVIYTSGTTGRPKGVRLNHAAWTYLAESVELIDLVTADMLAYLWLPLSHVFGLSMLAFQVKYGFRTAIDGRIDRIVDNLAVIRPDFMCGAPRIFEKVRVAVLTGDTSRGLTGRISRWAFANGNKSVPYRLAGQPMPFGLNLRYKLADKLVFSKLRAKMGGRIQFMISGAAKLSPQVQRWFYAAGIIVVEGYGMTESSAVSFVNHYHNPVFGTVGPAIPGLETKIAEDGELLLRGPVLMVEYHNNPEATAEVLEPDGWVHTGDIGHFDEQGNLIITDRKKDVMKTSGGKFVAPAKVEAAIVANVPYVAQAIAVGDGHKYIGALVVMDPDLLMRWGQRHGHPHDSYAELTQLPQIYRSVERLMARANDKLERWETVKKFAILDHELTVEAGAVTPSLKIRRMRVIQQHRDIVDALFDDSADEQ